MKKTILLFISLIVLNLNSFSQVAIAKLKFEDAETAYNVGDYAKTISRLADAEKLFGKINSPILHLRILAQNKLFQQTGEQELGFELKKNCATFLKDYAEIEALEEKFKEVYRISENLSEVPSNLEEVKLFKEKKNKEYQVGKQKYIETIDKYIQAIGGRNNLLNVQSIEIERELDPIGYLESNGQRFIAKRVKSLTRIKNKEVIFYEQKGHGIATTTYISTPGKLEWKTGRISNTGDEKQIERWNENLNIFPELNPLTEKDSVYYEEQLLNGNKVFVLTKKNESTLTKTIFDAITGLKVSENEKGYISKNTFQDLDLQYKTYKEIDGIKIPDLFVQKLVNTSPMSQAENNAFKLLNNNLIITQGPGVKSFSNSNTNIQSNTIKLNTVKQSFNTKIISLKINPEFRDKDLE